MPLFLGGQGEKRIFFCDNKGLGVTSQVRIKDKINENKVDGMETESTL
jgi:hypothetical protein